MTPSSMILHGTWLCAVSYCAELDSAEYDTAGNLTPPSIILRGVNLKNLEHLGKNKIKKKNILTHYSVAKADSNYENKPFENLVWLSL